MTFKVAAHDGGANSGLVLSGGSEDNEVDVDIANGANSVTTIAGKVNIANIPTSDPSVAGEIWSDSGTLKISAG